MMQAEVPPFRWRSIIVVASLVGIAIALALPAPWNLPQPAWRTALIGMLMALWWVSESVPLAATALVPIAAFPLAGVASIERIAQPYADPLIFLFLGGFSLAAAMQRWQLHKRLALAALAISGRSPSRVVLAMMIGTAFLSMWVSNTAATMVMVPIALSLVATEGGKTTGLRPGSANPQVDEREELSAGPFAPALMLGTAFAATIGGMGSLIGTPPNALFAGFVERTYGISVGFGEWMLIGLPIVIVLLPITWFILTRIVFRVSDAQADVELQAVRGPMSYEERVVATVIALTAAAWIFRPLLSRSSGINGLSDAGIAIAAALVLFLLPARSTRGTALLTWEDVKGIRWDVLILFGGGLALADAIKSSGLAHWLGQSAGSLAGVPVFLLVLLMMAAIVYLGELASNTAVAAIFLPIAGAVAEGIGIAPIALTLPVALAASLGFMLPVATPPNAIVFGTGAVSARQMLRAGAVIDVVSILLVFAIGMVLGPIVFDLRVGG